MRVRSQNTFLAVHAAGGAFCLLALFLALLCANIPFLSAWYAALRVAPVSLGCGEQIFSRPALFWWTEILGSMLVFLLTLAGRNFLHSEEARGRDRLLFPIFGALGGVLFPALFLYVWPGGNFAALYPTLGGGDAALGLALVFLLGSRVPVLLKNLLLGMMLFMNAFGLLAFTVSQGAELTLFQGSSLFLCTCFLAVANRARLRSFSIYALSGVLLWWILLPWSGHAFLAPVLSALFVPRTDGAGGRKASALLEDMNPLVSLLLLPFFVFVSGGVLVHSLSFGQLFWGIALAFFPVRLLGMCGFLWLGMRLRLCAMPPGMSWKDLFGICLVCGIGLASGLFFAELSPLMGDARESVKGGLLCAFIFAALCGGIFLHQTQSRRRNTILMRAE